MEGWLTELEQVALLYLPALVDHLPGEVVEIGSYQGKSTIALGLGSKWLSTRERSVIAIDPFNPHGDKDYPDSYYSKEPYFEKFWNNVKKLDWRIM